MNPAPDFQEVFALPSHTWKCTHTLQTTVFPFEGVPVHFHVSRKGASWDSTWVILTSFTSLPGIAGPQSIFLDLPKQKPYDLPVSALYFL